jgi:hypothetical protein
MISEIIQMGDYQKNLKRVNRIVSLLDIESPNSKYPGSPSLLNSIQYHKLHINPQNKLQILISEAAYLLKLIIEYEKKL